MTRFLLLAGLLVVSCDPAISIYQLESQTAKHSATKTNTQVAVTAKTIHSLIGETWYATGISVTNSIGSPITVTEIQLVANGKTHANKNITGRKYPLTIPSGSVEALDVWFDLDQDVWTTFKEAAELQVHYQNGTKDEVASAFVIKGRLNQSN